MVELGGGTNPHPRADFVIDLHHPHGAPAQDATRTPWMTRHLDPEPPVDHALPDGCADEVFASHFLEHVPAGQPRIDVFNEARRILRPGGTFTIVLPLIGYTDPTTGAPMSNQIGWQPYADPTHVSQWWFPESLLYFCAGPFKPHADYGIREWAPLDHYLDETMAGIVLATDQRVCYEAATVPGPPSFWSVRQGWEGIARLVKP